MLKAIVLICSVSNGPCNDQTALDIMRLPESYPVPTACFLEGQRYVALLSISGEFEKYKMVVHCEKAR